jgi:DNA-binding PadR family transcriptional regulator
MSWSSLQSRAKARDDKLPQPGNNFETPLALDQFLQYCEEMRKGDYLGNFELMLLLALLRLGEDAYGVTIAQELEEQTGREVVVASVYATLERLRERGLVTSRLGDSTPERGGRAKRYFRITGAGIGEVREAQRSLMNLWKGLPELKGEKA